MASEIMERVRASRVHGALVQAMGSESPPLDVAGWALAMESLAAEQPAQNEFDKILASLMPWIEESLDGERAWRNVEALWTVAAVLPADGLVADTLYTTAIAELNNGGVDVLDRVRVNPESSRFLRNQRRSFLNDLANDAPEVAQVLSLHNVQQTEPDGEAGERPRPSVRRFPSGATDSLWKAHVCADAIRAVHARWHGTDLQSFVAPQLAEVIADELVLAGEDARRAIEVRRGSGFAVAEDLLELEIVQRALDSTRGGKRILSAAGHTLGRDPEKRDVSDGPQRTARDLSAIVGVFSEWLPVSIRGDRGEGSLERRLVELFAADSEANMVPLLDYFAGAGSRDCFNLSSQLMIAPELRREIQENASLSGLKLALYRGPSTDRMVDGGIVLE